MSWRRLRRSGWRRSANYKAEASEPRNTRMTRKRQKEMRLLGGWQVWRGVLSLAMAAMLCVFVVRANQDISEGHTKGAERTEVVTTAKADTSIRYWDLAVAGGIFMIPIAAMSILAVTMS